jgi:Uma2 family endonuclease
MAATVQRPTRQATRQRATPDRVILRGVSWTTYQSLLDDFVDCQAPRFAFDRGALEIVVTLSTEHEATNRTLAFLVGIAAAELAVDVRDVGGMTFRRADIERGFESDSCFYVQHEANVRGHTQVDPANDPPPELVIEIDVGRFSLDKFPIYAAIGVPEVWRCERGRVAVHLLRASGYEQAAASAALPLLTTDILNRFLAEGRSLSRLAWLRAVREWARARAANRP